MYLKHFVFLIILTLGIDNLMAQEKHSFVGIRSGVSIPIRKYCSTTLDGGNFIQAGFRYDISPCFGIVLD